MEQWKTFLDKQIKLIYEDSENHFSKKIGRVIEVNNTHLILIDGIQEAILLTKILRVEEVGE